MGNLDDPKPENVTEDSQTLPTPPVDTPEDTPEDTPKPEDKPTDKPKMYTVKVDGEEMEVTEDELVSNYQLAKASQQRMQEAAEQKKQLQEDLELAELLRKVASGDQEAGVELIKRTVDDPDKVKEFSDMVNQAKEQPDDSSDGDTQYAELPPDVKEWIESQKKKEEQEELARLRAQALSETEKRVDQDEILGTIDNDKVKKYASDLAKREVERRVGLGHAAWPDVLDEVIPFVRKELKNVGILGQSGPGDTQVGFAGTPTPETSPQPKEPPKKADINSPDFEKDVGKELMWRLKNNRAKRTVTMQDALR